MHEGGRAPGAHLSTALVHHTCAPVVCLLPGLLSLHVPSCLARAGTARGGLATGETETTYQGRLWQDARDPKRLGATPNQRGQPSFAFLRSFPRAPAHCAVNLRPCRATWAPWRATSGATWHWSPLCRWWTTPPCCARPSCRSCRWAAELACPRAVFGWWFSVSCSWLP